MKWLEKNKKYVNLVPYILLIAIFLLVIFQNILSIIDNSIGGLGYTLYSLAYIIESIVMGLALEFGFLLYFFQLNTKKEKNKSKNTFILVYFCLISIVNCILGLLKSGFFGLIFNLLVLFANLGIIQYFISTAKKKNKNNKILVLVSCILMVINYVLRFNFKLVNLLLILFFLSLLPYFYFLDLKDNERVQLNKEIFDINKSHKIKISILIAIYFAVGLIMSNFQIVNIYTMVTILILIYNWLNARKLAIVIAGYEIIMEFFYIIFRYELYESLSIKEFITIIILTVVLINLFKTPIEKRIIKKNEDYNIEKDNKDNSEELAAKNKKYKELLDMGIIDQEEYKKVTKN